MRVRVIQHVPFEDVGCMRSWLAERCCDVAYTRLFAGESLPARCDDADLVIVMGGPMSANDEALFPWLRAEKQFLRDAVARNVAVLGVCLGAQLLATAFGARVYPNRLKEIGWFPVRGVKGAADTFQFPDEAVVFHWHGETFDLPPGAVRLAESEACANQAFQIGRRAIGLQFHLEMTLSGVCLLAEHCYEDLAPGAYVQGELELLNSAAERFQAGHEQMDRVLDYLTAVA